VTEWTNKYNSFNSMKALVHVEYWQQVIDSGIIPPPRFVSIDPCGICNFHCSFCNASKVMTESKDKMTIKIIENLLSLLKFWGVRSGCVGGGGESLLNPNTYYLIDQLYLRGIDIGVVTNGSCIDDIATLLKCKWIGFSMDAATHKTYSLMKGVPESWFDRVLSNIQYLTSKGTEISYKYLLHPNNCTEIYDACKIAKEIGCDLVHIRPGAEPWFSNDRSWEFSGSQIEQIQRDIVRARENFEDENFKVYGITHKFSPTLGIKKSFKKCYACFTTCVISPNGDVGICCDRRGDTTTVLGNINTDSDVMEASGWGSKKHWDIHSQIDVSACPRCTLGHVNEIFENVIIEDKMLYNMY